MQILAASIITMKADIWLNITQNSSLQDIDLPPWLIVSTTIFTAVVITNAFNLIDGIDGLAASIGLLISLLLGSWFYLAGSIEYAVLTLALTGALAAFLIYNAAPAQVLMGDTGSLFLGLVIAVLSIQFINMNASLPLKATYAIPNGLVVISALLIVPLFDILRVFTVRLLQGQNPFRSDMQHIHHLLIEYGFTPGYAACILLAFSICMVLICTLLNPVLTTSQLLLLQISTAALLSYRLHSQVRKKRYVDQ